MKNFIGSLGSLPWTFYFVLLGLIPLALTILYGLIWLGVRWRLTLRSEQRRRWRWVGSRLSLETLARRRVLCLEFTAWIWLLVGFCDFVRRGARFHQGQGWVSCLPIIAGGLGWLVLAVTSYEPRARTGHPHFPWRRWSLKAGS